MYRSYSCRGPAADRVHAVDPSVGALLSSPIPAAALQPRWPPGAPAAGACEGFQVVGPRGCCRGLLLRVAPEGCACELLWLLW